jgi:hypothetical protein
MALAGSAAIYFLCSDTANAELITLPVIFVLEHAFEIILVQIPIFGEGIHCTIRCVELQYSVCGTHISARQALTCAKFQVCQTMVRAMGHKPPPAEPPPAKSARPFSVLKKMRSTSNGSSSGHATYGSTLRKISEMLQDTPVDLSQAVTRHPRGAEALQELLTSEHLIVSAATAMSLQYAPFRDSFRKAGECAKGMHCSCCRATPITVPWFLECSAVLHVAGIFNFCGGS